MAPRKKADPTKRKSVVYRRVDWNTSKKKKPNLEKLMRDCHLQLPTAGDRTFAASGGTITGSSVKDNNGIFLQITAYVPGESASTIEQNAMAVSSNVGAEPAPFGKDYIDGEVFAYIKGNNITMCTTKVREKVLLAYIQSVLMKCNYCTESVMIDITRVAKVSKVKMIQDKGVKEIRLNTSLYEASLHHQRNSSKVSKLTSVLAQEFKSLFASDNALKDIKQFENLNVSLSIKFDGREAHRKNRPPRFGLVGRKRLGKTAELLVDAFETHNEDGFTIITNDNQTITSDEIRVAETFKIKVLGKSLSKINAWQVLEDYHERLDKSGILVQ